MSRRWKADQLEIAATEESAAGRYRDICVGVHVGESGVEQGVSDTLLKALQESVPSQLNAVLKSATRNNQHAYQQ